MSVTGGALALALALTLTLALALTYRGSEKGAIWGGVDVASANLQNSNHRRLARASRRGLRGQSPQVLPNTNASRAVRRSPVSRLFPSPSTHRHAWRGARRKGAPVMSPTWFDMYGGSTFRDPQNLRPPTLTA